jgi:hypothetical protein
MKMLNVVVFISFIALVIFLGNLVGSVETLEERLNYYQPVVEKSSIVKANKEINVEVIAQPIVANANGEDIKYTYVPSYSHVYHNHGRPLLLESTLSIRNTDPRYGLTIHKVDYYDSKGNVVRSFLKDSVSMKPLSSNEYLKDKLNEKGGFGAFFVVLWSSDNPLAVPIIESVMTDSSANKQLAFVNKGLTLPFEFYRNKD